MSEKLFYCTILVKMDAMLVTTDGEHPTLAMMRNAVEEELDNGIHPEFNCFAVHEKKPGDDIPHEWEPSLPYLVNPDGKLTAYPQTCAEFLARRLLKDVDNAQ